MTALGRQARMPRQADRKHPHLTTTRDADTRVLVDHVEASAGEPVTSQSADPVAVRLAYSVAEAALLTGLSRDLLYDQMRLRNLGYLKVGRRRIITRENLKAFLARETS